MGQNPKEQTESGRLPEGLTLRALRVADAEQYHAMLQLPASVHGNPHVPFESVAVTQAYIEKLDAREIAIAAMLGDTLVGEAELTPFKGRRAHAGSIGIGVHDAWQRRGIGSTLMAELLDLADNWLGLRRVELMVFADNQAALALYRKFGFEIEAHQRGAVLRRGVLIDCYLMARLREAVPFIPADSVPTFALDIAPNLATN